MAEDVYSLEYPIIGPYMDASQSPTTIEDGFFSWLSGVDGRFRGSLCKYPGHWTPLNIGLESTDTISFFQYASMMVYVSSAWVEVRGFVYRYYEDATSKYIIKYVYNQVGADSFTTKTIAGGGLTSDVTSDDMWITTHGKYMYIFIEGATDFPKIMYSKVSGSSSTFEVETLGVKDTDDSDASLATGELDAPTGSSFSSAGGYLNFRGLYRIALRYYHSGREVYSGLTDILDVDLSGEVDGSSDTLTGNLCSTTIAISTGAKPVDTDYDYVEVYRTMNLRNPFDTYQGGVFYRETYIDRASIDSGDVTPGANKQYVGLLHDTALVQQKRYDPWADPVTVPPNSGACMMYEGSLFAGQDPATNGGVGMVWSNPYRNQREEFGSEYSYTGHNQDGKIIRFMQIGDNMLALTGSVIYLVKKIAGEVGIIRIKENISIVGRNAINTIGSQVIMLASQGLIVMDPQNGGLQTIRSVDRIIMNEWKGTLANVSIAYDSKMACTYILNPDKKQMICLWDNSKSPTMLEGCPYSYAVNGPSIKEEESGVDAVRAYFVTSHGRVVIPDYDQSQGTYASSSRGAMGGLRVTNSVVSTEGQISYTGGSDDRVLWIATGMNAGSIFYTEDASYATDIAEIPVGTEYSIDPVIVRMRFKPLRIGENNPSFLRKIIKAITLSIPKLSDFDSGYSKQFRVGVYRNGYGETGESLAKSAYLSASTNPSDNAVAMNIDGMTLEPYVEQGSGGTNFELTGLQVTGTITQSRKVADNS